MAVTRDDVVGIFIAARECVFTLVEPEMAFGFGRPMATKAGAFKNGVYVAVENNLKIRRRRQTVRDVRCQNGLIASHEREEAHDD